MWTFIPGFTKYLISRDALIRNKKTGVFIAKTTLKDGRQTVTLYSDENKKVTRIVSYFVSLTFLPNPDPNVYKSIYHLDGDKQNNCVDNLAWYRGGRKSLLIHEFRNKKVVDKTEEFLVYCELHPRASREEIADHFNITKSKVNDLVEMFNIKVGRYQQTRGTKEVRDIQKMYYVEGMTMKDIAHWTERSYSFVRRVINRSYHEDKQLSMEELKRYKKWRERLGGNLKNARI